MEQAAGSPLVEPVQELRPRGQDARQGGEDTILGHRSGGQSLGSRRNNSRMPRDGSSVRTGWCAHMIESGTMIVRDQELTAYRLIGIHRGSRTTSGGTAGQIS